ncbi:hypothetical protein POM88_030525 [Heracleum sosnowskyi]|uniref:Retrotransposon gag domain-containing protein n=1 Tax=Heracleum sosnowskyi TaxID=360622 RepID=A0AAD8HVN8_9APIA|nr:hypothetical protein POM88_030525 [Heracleum sosnowskyi]
MPRSTEEVDTTPPSPNSGITLQQFIDQRRKEKQQKLSDSKIKMADLPVKSLKNYSQPSPSGVPTGLAMPAIQAANFEIKPALFTMIQQNQFAGLPSEDPTLHLQRTDELVDKMTAFKQEYGESLRDAWERFKDLQRACPHHGLEKWFLLKRFYNGLDPETKGTVDNAAGGVFLDKGVDEAHNFLANLAANHFSNPRALRKGGKLEVDAYSLLSSQLAALTQEISSLKTTHTSTPPPPMSINALSSMAPMNNPVCEVCGIQGHLATICSQHMHHRPPLLRSITTTTTPGINRARGFLPQNHLAFLVLDHLHRRLPPVLHTCIAHLCCVSSTPRDTALIQPHGLHEYCRNIRNNQLLNWFSSNLSLGVYVNCIQASSLSAPTMGRSSAPSSAPPNKKQKQSSIAPSSAAPSSRASTVVSQRYPAVKGILQSRLWGKHNALAELSHKLEKVGWTDLLIMDEPSYSTLTYEFLSSFTVTSEGSLSFRIANQSHVITKAELATMFGWQLVEQHPLPEDYATPCWLKITGLPSTESYKAQSASASAIISHCYRYFARLLSFTMFGRAESLLIERFLYHAQKRKGALVMGGFITRIAEELAIFDRTTTNLKVMEGWSSELDSEYLIGMKMLRRSGKAVHAVPHKRHDVEPMEELAEPAQTLEEQVAEIKANQIQIIQSQERMGKQLDDISASIQRYFSDPTP